MCDLLVVIELMSHGEDEVPANPDRVIRQHSGPMKLEGTMACFSNKRPINVSDLWQNVKD
jgi:hypothetical protein